MFRSGNLIVAGHGEWPYSWFMAIEREISNLETKISLLRKQEFRLLTVIGDEAASKRARSKARTELREIMLAIIEASHEVRNLEARR